MPEGKHTPLPWKNDCFQVSAGFDRICHTGAGNLQPVPQRSYEAEANAEFIVRACNSHYELLEALKAILTDCTFEKRSDVSRNVNEYRAAANAAIAKAEGK